ncbi:MAG TPA: methylated-DNA--[protein]-cysteine S-methyltransferase [Vicinamibacterales bacterium]|jgi:methylated-DNA-[protein]-cysteine S-methyltransferase|nr:methylated-DNA--[protein]-cysteine S-methyltransferase [Vicinamibacterales bacterium]
MDYCLFETTIGTCGVVWGEHGLKGVHLPDANPARTRASVTRRFPGAVPAEPTPDIQQAIDGIVALLRGEKRDLREIALDFDGVPAFNRRVYQLARTIPPGATLTYGDIALRLGSPGTARAVGQALGQNPWPIVVPCHRVLAADGRMGGFSAPGGVGTKRRMLEIEGVEGVRPEPTLF